MQSEIKIIFEDQDIVVINKPAGVVTNKANSVKSQTIQDWFEKRYLEGEELNYEAIFPADWQAQIPADFNDEYGSPEEIFAERLGMVHRLDKDTSGILILAKHPGSLVNLLKQFREREVQKEYLALTHGKFRVEQGTINAPLGRARKDRKKFAVTVDGRNAVTAYKVDQKFKTLDWDLFSDRVGKSDDSFTSGKNITAGKIKKIKKLYEAGFSLVRCLPKTGRTHQIRVHLAHEKHPLVGDIIYLGKKRAKVDPTWCPRHFLHAHSLEITHPGTKEKIKFEAELSQDLKQVLELLVAE